MTDIAPAGEKEGGSGENALLKTSRPSRFLINKQGQNLTVLRKVAGSALYYSVAGNSASLDNIKNLDELLAAEYELKLSRRSQTLVNAWWRWLSFSGEFEEKPGELPTIMFSQWTFRTLLEVAKNFPFPVSSMLNQASRVQCNHVIPADAPLIVKAQMTKLEDQARKLRCEMRMTSGTEEYPNAIEATIVTVVPKPKSKWTEGGGAKKKRDPAEVDANARLLRTVKLEGRTGVDFGMISGDFNPIHTSSIYAKLAGFKTNFIQGFGAQAVIMSVLVNTLCGGDQEKLKVCETRFISPVYFPTKACVYVEESDAEERQLWLASQDTGKVYIIGSFALA